MLTLFSVFSFDFILLLCTAVLFTVGIFKVMLPKIKGQATWKKIVNWVLYCLFFIIAPAGISFVQINSEFGHETAAGFGTFLFLGMAVVIAVIWARTMNIIGTKKEMKEVA